MTSFALTGASTTARSLQANETGFVGPQGTLTPYGTAVSIEQTAATGLTSITALGAIHSDTSDAITSLVAAGSVLLTVGAQGSVTSGSVSDAAIDLLLLNFARITNAGLMAGDRAMTLRGTAGVQEAAIINTGMILGSSTLSSAISIDSNYERLSLTNDGTIMHSGTLRAVFAQSTSGGLTVVNSGTISTLGPTALESRGELALRNSGTIIGDVAFNTTSVINNAGLIVGNIADGSNTGTNEIENSGRITGDIDLFNGTTTLLRNSGRIDGAITIFASNGGISTFDNTGGEVGGVVSFSGQVQMTNTGTLHDDVLLSSQNDFFDGSGGQVIGQILGNAGDDLFIIDRSDIRISGGSGIDRVVSSVSSIMGYGTEILELTGDADRIGIGRTGNETITSGTGHDRLEGRKGNDFLNAGDGNDTVLGGAGNDTLVLSDGTDTLNGGADSDTLFANNDFYNYAINLNLTTASGIDRATDVIEATGVLASIENAIGADGNDNFVGSKGANLLVGKGSADTLVGFDGNDTLLGGTGNDSLSGGKDDDVLTGAAGVDTMAGGAGRDVFVFSATTDSAPGLADLIQGFVLADDRIDLSAIDADLVAAGDQGFAFVGAALFAGTAPQVRFTQIIPDNVTVVQARLTNEAAPAVEVVLEGLVSLTADNFIL